MDGSDTKTRFFNITIVTKDAHTAESCCVLTNERELKEFLIFHFKTNDTYVYRSASEAGGEIEYVLDRVNVVTWTKVKTFREQVELMAYTDIFLSYPGADMCSMLFMPTVSA